MFFRHHHLSFKQVKWKNKDVSQTTQAALERYFAAVRFCCSRKHKGSQRIKQLSSCVVAYSFKLTKIHISISHTISERVGPVNDNLKV